MRQTRPMVSEMHRRKADGPTARAERPVVLRLVTSNGEARPYETPPATRPADHREAPSSRPLGHGRRVRPYIEALIGWLVIFGLAYIALLALGD